MLHVTLPSKYSSIMGGCSDLRVEGVGVLGFKPW
jgi:hypothetical protein